MCDSKQYNETASKESATNRGYYLFVTSPGFGSLFLVFVPGIIDIMFAGTCEKTNKNARTAITHPRSALCCYFIRINGLQRFSNNAI